MNDDRRNPYLILGVDYGTGRDRATEAFARRSRAARRDPAFPYGIDDLTWALHQVEEQVADPGLDLATFRVPADPSSLEPPPGPGVLRFDAVPLVRRTGPVTDAMVDELRRRALHESIADAIEDEAAQVSARYGFSTPVAPVAARVAARRAVPAPPPPPPRHHPRSTTAPGMPSPGAPRRSTGRIAAAIAAAVVLAAATGFVAARLSSGGDNSGTSREVDRAAAAPDSTADRPRATTPVTSPVATQPPSPSTVRATTTVATTTTAPGSPAAGHPYFTALTQWSLAGALKMQELSWPQSPAWAYGRHLEQSFRAGGGSLSTSFTPTGADSGDFCIGSSCFAITRIALQDERMYSFEVNGSDLDAMSSAWTADEAPYDCWYEGGYTSCPGANAVTMRVTTVYTVGTTTWISVEVDAGSYVSPNSEPRTALVRTFSGSVESSGFSGSNPITQGSMTVWLFKFSGVINPEITEFTVLLGWNGTEFDWTFSSL